MVRGLYTSALGMITQMNKMDVVSNNIANVNTTSYKKDIVATSSFDDVLAKRTHDLKDNIFPPFAKKVGNITYGVYVDEIHTDFTTGNLQTTSGVYDMAINGSGFFVVNTADRYGNVTEKYTRDGSFTLDSNGFLVAKNGGYVQGENGDIQIPVGYRILIEKNGVINVDGENVGTIRTIDFEDLKTLRKQGDNYYIATGASVAKDFTGEIVSGVLEASNVNTVREMVDLITVNRVYEANQKILQAIDTTLQRSVTEIGRKA